MVLFVTFPLQIKSTGSEVKLRKNLLGWAEQSHSARGKAVLSDEELCQGWRKPESCCIPKEAEMMGLCGFKHKVSACPSSLDGARGRKASCTRAVSPACTHSWPYAGSSLATAVTFSERQERFWFPFCKIDRNLSVLWEAVLHLSPHYPWTRSTLLKIVQSATMSSLNCDPTSSALFDSPFLWKYSSFPS